MPTFQNEVNTFNDFSIAAQENYPLISLMSFTLKPQVGANLFDVNPLESDTGDMFKMGLMEEVKGEEIIHHEANKRFSAPYLNSSTTVTDVYGTVSWNGATLDYIQLATESHSPSTSGSAGGYSYPRAGQLIQFKNGDVWRIQYKLTTTPNAHRLYITKLKTTNSALSSTITLSGSTYGGDQFSVFTTAFEEATSGMQSGIVPTSKTYVNTLQSFSERYEITDFQERNETWPLNWQGKTINFTYQKGINDTEVRFAVQEDMGLFLTPQADSSAVAYDTAGVAQRLTTTQAYLPNLELNAQKLYYDNNPTLALFEQIIRLRRKMNQGPKCLVQHGFEFGLKVKDILNQFGVNGGMTYDRQDVDLGINKVKFPGDFEFALKELRMLNHPDFTYLAGFPYPWYFIIAPMDKTKDPKTNIMLNAFSIIYKKMVGRGARGHYKIAEYGGNSEAGTDEKNWRFVKISSRKGTRVVGASRFILGRKAA